jgi:AcrR family transcriptional regulator
LADRGFESLSLREVTRAAGISPTAFYRHFQDMDELGYALVDESVHHLRTLLRDARRAGQLPPRTLIRSSVEILIPYVQSNRPYFRFLARERAAGHPSLRRSIRHEIQLFSNELSADFLRFPEWQALGDNDRQIVADLMVSSMVATIETALELEPGDEESQEDLTRSAITQLRLIALAALQWQSASFH